jgi:hypothetical protein
MSRRWKDNVSYEGFKSFCSAWRSIHDIKVTFGLSTGQAHACFKYFSCFKDDFVVKKELYNNSVEVFFIKIV